MMENQKHRLKMVSTRRNEDELYMLDILARGNSDNRSAAIRFLIRKEWDALGMPALGLVKARGILESDQ